MWVSTGPGPLLPLLPITWQAVQPDCAATSSPAENVVFSFILWPDKATRDAGWAKMMEQGPPPGEMPWDGKRMFWGGFTPVVSL